MKLLTYMVILGSAIVLVVCIWMIYASMENPLSY